MRPQVLDSGLVTRWIVAPSPEHEAIVAGALDVVRARREGGGPGAAHGWTPLRNHAQRTVLVRRTPERDFFCKVYAPRSSWRLSRVRHALKSPAARAVEWFRRLDALGVPTVPIVAAGELRGGSPMLGRVPSFLVTSAAKSQATLRRVLVDGRLPRDARIALAERIRRLADELHRARIGSLELRPENVLADTEDGRILLFDLDRLVGLWLPYRTRRVTGRDRDTVAATCAELLDAS